MFRKDIKNAYEEQIHFYVAIVFGTVNIRSDMRLFISPMRRGYAVNENAIGEEQGSGIE